MLSKTCTKCGGEKDLELFDRDAKGRLGRKSQCKECLSAHKCGWYRKDTPSRLAVSQAWRDENRDRIRERDANRYQRDGDAIRARSRAWYAANKERAADTYRAWAERNPESASVRSQRRRARLAGVPTDGHTAAQLQVYLSSFLPVCFWCGGEYTEDDPRTADHVQPLSKSGHHALFNLVPAHLSCNSGKRDKTPAEWAEYIVREARGAVQT